VDTERGAGPQHDLLLADLLADARHKGCGGQPAKVELLSSAERVDGRPVRRIVLRGGSE
jgi:hypothetical protein